ncbi:MAG: hypothetical protein AB7G47_01580 [Mycolicibacterium sp.]|uniref:hypothetical protein n=1 Tax=Mycolicibacterium sp. TaxID=2320850 RepID=UPI003D0F4D68
MFATAHRRTLPVVRWFQLGGAAAGIGLALAAGPGIAAADDSPGATATGPSRGPTASRSAGGDVDSATTENADQSRVDPDSAATGEDRGDEIADHDREEIAEEAVTPVDPQAEAGSIADANAYEAFEEDDNSDATAPNADRISEIDRNSVDAPSAEQDAEQDTDEATATEEEDATAIVDESHMESQDSGTNTAKNVAMPTNLATLTTKPLSAPTQSWCECDRPATFIASISVTLDRFLTEAANRLAALPDRPFTSFLEGALYLVRRTLFPASVGVITTPVKVPLFYTPTTTSSGEPKLGIWLAAAGSTTPQLFEFDTGSAGLYAAYASAVPDDSPWWGSNFTPQQKNIGVSFDSGLVYQGNSVSTAVSLFGSQYSCAALVNTGKVTVGQMDQIGTATEPDAFWSPAGSSTGEPPIDGAFYGDFGMALTYQPDDVMNVISQLTYGWGVRPGFRVHADPITGEAWVQIGLTRKDLHQSDGMYFAMVPDSLAPPGARVPNSGADYYALQPFDATINILDEDGKSVINDPGTPILPDTGAGTTLHNTQWSPPPSPKRYKDDLIDWTEKPTKGKLYPGLTFFLSGITTDGTPVTFFEFGTAESTDGGRVAVQNTATSQGSAPTDQYYLNTGLSLFQMYDVVYFLGNSKGGGTLGLIPQGLQAPDRRQNTPRRFSRESERRPGRRAHT